MFQKPPNNDALASEWRKEIHKMKDKEKRNEGYGLSCRCVYVCDCGVRTLNKKNSTQV